MAALHDAIQTSSKEKRAYFILFFSLSLGDAPDTLSLLLIKLQLFF